MLSLWIMFFRERKFFELFEFIAFPPSHFLQTIPTHPEHSRTNKWNFLCSCLVSLSPPSIQHPYNTLRHQHFCYSKTTNYPKSEHKQEVCLKHSSATKSNGNNASQYHHHQTFKLHSPSIAFTSRELEQREKERVLRSCELLKIGQKLLFVKFHNG